VPLVSELFGDAPFPGAIAHSPLIASVAPAAVFICPRNFPLAMSYAAIVPLFQRTIVPEAAGMTVGAPSDGEDDSIPYGLTVYAGGKRYRAQANNYGDWYDIVTVLNVLNRVTEDLRAPERFTPLKSTDQTLIVVAATPATMANAVKAGLLETDADPRGAERRGKEFEVEVRQALPAR